jgi:hypothetical protein
VKTVFHTPMSPDSLAKSFGIIWQARNQVACLLRNMVSPVQLRLNHCENGKFWPSGLFLKPVNICDGSADAGFNSAMPAVNSGMAVMGIRLQAQSRNHNAILIKIDALDHFAFLAILDF